MKLTIITINLNNADGLHKTMHSVFDQTFQNFEYIVIDGKSTDGSLDVIKNFVNNISKINFKWISEPDSGIYNAMNKGISMAKGEYLQFLNSGDYLASNAVIGQMIEALKVDTQILYGNMLKPIKNKIIIDRGFSGRQPTMLDFYRGTLNHSPAFINKILFDKFGLYDETMKIVSDWKWYLQVIVLNNTNINYIDVNVSVFDMNGISNINKKVELEERNEVLCELIPVKILINYENNLFTRRQFISDNILKIYNTIVFGIFKIKKHK